MTDPATPADRPTAVLLVEDSPGDIRLVRDLARQCEFPLELHVVMSGEEALEFLRRRERHAGAAAVDLVLLDLYLPDMDGRQVLAEIRQDPALQHLPVVVVSSMLSPEDIVATDRLGTSGHLTKPLNGAALGEILRLRRADA